MVAAKDMADALPRGGQDLRKRVQRGDALRGIDLDVYTGELMMLVGPSGCGKTTLISVIAGILDRDTRRRATSSARTSTG